MFPGAAPPSATPPFIAAWRRRRVRERGIWSATSLATSSGWRTDCGSQRFGWSLCRHEDTNEFVAIVRGIDLVPRDEFMLHNSRILTKRFSLENRGLLRDGATPDGTAERFDG